MKPKKKRRDPLNIAHQTKPRKAYIDYDYVAKLSKEERNFLARFTDEFYGGGFQKDGDDYSENNLHKTQDLRRECYKRNKDQLHCVYNLAGFSNRLDKIQDINQDNNEVFYTESIEDKLLREEDVQLKTELLEKLKETGYKPGNSTKTAKNPNSSLNKRKMTK